MIKTKNRIKKELLPTYRIDRSYEENYNLGPHFTSQVPKEIPVKEVNCLGFRLRSPIGIFAGPLSNSKWIKFYAQLGFSILSYKTVRTYQKESFPPPNCVYVDTRGQLALKKVNRPDYLFPKEDPGEEISITTSFGIPSQNPEIWQADVARAKSYLKEGQMLIVSVVGDDVEDFVKCASLAKSTGAQTVEVNLSCPNVKTKEGSIFLDPELSKIVTKEVKKEIEETPLLMKIGYIEEDNLLERLIRGVADIIDGVVCTNGIPIEVRKKSDRPLLGEERLVSGIGGDGIRACSQHMVKRIVKIKKELKANFAVLGGGGILQPKHIQEYLDLGADIAMTATGAMWNPLLAYQYLKGE